VPADRRIEFRIGINLGDIIKDGRDVYGDGVNVAARLEALATPGGICVSRVVRDQVRDKLGFAFDDRGEQQVKNIARPVRVFDVKMAGETMALIPDSAAGAPLPLPDKPSIAVLPFQNMSGDPEQEYFADGMVEEIITALSRIRWLFVIARNSTFTYKGQALDVKQVGRELGVRYVLEGSVRKASDRVRITAQLIDATTGTHLWADRFDGSLADVFELQDQVAINVARIIEPTLQAAEVRRAADRPTSDPTAYDLYLRAVPLWASHEKEPITQALSLLTRAIERDPQYGPALALAALCHQLFAVSDWTNNSETHRREGLDLARRALRCAPDDPDVLANAAVVLGSLEEDIDLAISSIDRALALNPSFARGWVWSARLRNYAGQPDLAIAHFNNSLRLSPRDRMGTFSLPLGGAYFLKHQFADAAAILLAALEQAPGLPIAYQLLASCYAHMGRLGEAREVVMRLKTITSIVVPRIVPFRNQEHRELFLSGLYLAIGEPT
jgi:TolB-like protein